MTSPMGSDAWSGPRLGVVIPGRNEALRIGAVLEAMPDRPSGVGSMIVILVDDGSHDATGEVARSRGALVVRHPIGLGKGASLTTGCAAAIARGCDLIALMDADGQHRPADLARLVAPLVSGASDLVLGFRRFTRRMPPAMRLGNWGLSLAFQTLLRHPVTDTQCGLRAFRAEVYPQLRWRANDYSVETEMLIRAVRHRLRITEVEIETIYLDRYKGTTVADGLRIFGDLLRGTLAQR